ncbi:Gmad2 immunoglobulin-like domain-containing protein [Micromonospora sp. WMMD1082]|uniref:Gmad2 immunoglobulin-like domain-containing protein n=1 Tax=Micromonospora sp. WMMD1082 TaxID=3016104 RepID=UPI0024160A5B|nr:Gmad2 immunoglobulin-like domain-containing protein [Micromonospora sp. WMMD1082]MDG4797809.1 Gmad2 immunoglobulin-like domain-containing protein [Micromonospora sp. WMMD1082]
MSRRPVAVATLLLLLASGCAPSRSGSLGPAPTAAAPTTAGPTSGGAPTTSAPPPAGTTAPAPPTTGAAGTSRPATLTLELWYVRDGRLAPTRRTRPATVATSRLALSELAAGPTPVETAAGLVTLLPDGAEVSRIDARVATVRLAAAPDPVTGRLREAQVVYTLTQFATVRQVAFGTTAPAGRADYADLLPPIVVTGPVIGDRVTSPVTVTGTADVFEATVTVRVLDTAGRQLATAFTTATCGTGCRGAYRVAVGYRLARTQIGTIEVYEVSAADGSRTKLVAVPVTLAATR